MGKSCGRWILGKQTHTWGFASSPVIHGDVCILYFGPGERAFLLGLDKRSGRELWRVKDPPIAKRPRTDGFRGQEDGIVGSFSSPILVEANGRAEVVMSYPQLICAYDPKTGKSCGAATGLNELLYGSPIAGEGVVVAMGGFLGTTVAVRAGGSGDVTDTHRLWRQERTKNRLGSGVIHDGHVYI
jgi:outer membrane protein assembly factor BamB